ncbi:phosphatidylinositol N-acetylglucosaminyltransferase subunit H isoform X2 [Clinocottus analis]|uniref:phosphatidylinositol N-acetylglucosaminyltransferase subunit H isoform X2 n=1 Tax=Clinocottus analis TaxID=304258 RepID=UPI0035C05566
MEDEAFTDITGKPISLDCQSHSSLCREFTVSVPKVSIDHESLIVIRSLGIQLSSSYASGRETTTFIEMSKIKDIVINEAIYMQQIIYHLCVLLKDPSDPDAVSSVVPLFQSSKPRLNCLVKVYKSCQEILSKC